MIKYDENGKPTQEYLQWLFMLDKDIDHLRWKNPKANRCHIGDIAGTPHNRYVKICIDIKYYQEHDLIYCYVYGMWPKTQLDHKDTIRNNNNINNLRTAFDQSHQNANQKVRKNNTSGYKGVSFDAKRKRYEAYINIDYRKYHLGYCVLAEDAACLYDKKAIATWGEFAYTNFPVENYL